jgi:uncharacterized protein
MKHRVQLLTLIGLLLIQFAHSQQASSLLWEISGNGLTKPSYLFGTIHMLPHEKFSLSDAVKKKFNNSEKIVMEIDMDNPSMLMEVQAAMVMKDTILDSLLSKKDLKIVSAFFADSLGVPLMMMNKVKPLLLSSLIMQKFIGPNPASFENTFTEMAKTAGKEILGMETVKEQMSYIDKISLVDQGKCLVESVVDYEKSKLEFKQLVDIYLTNDINKVYKKMIESLKDYEEFGDFLIVERNHNWVPRIEKFTKEYSCFIAVGSGHLGGENGVLALLLAKGYTVKAVL